MKNKRLFVGILVVFAIVIGGLIWWHAPCPMTDIMPSEVSKIEIFDGYTGQSMTITNPAEISHMINNLNSVPLKKEKLSLGFTGYSFRTTVYKMNGNPYKSFIINSNDTIRKDPFFYRATAGNIDYAYIRQLFNGR